MIGIRECDWESAGVIRDAKATVETARETELERRLEEAERRIAVLTAAAVVPSAGRKTVSAGTAVMMGKSGLAEGLEAGAVGAVDAALVSLSIEQRIAVKSELLRAGLLG